MRAPTSSDLDESQSSPARVNAILGAAGPPGMRRGWEVAVSRLGVLKKVGRADLRSAIPSGRTAQTPHLQTSDLSRFRLRTDPGKVPCHGEGHERWRRRTRSVLATDGRGRGHRFGCGRLREIASRAIRLSHRRVPRSGSGRHPDGRSGWGEFAPKYRAVEDARTVSRVPGDSPFATVPPNGGPEA